MSWEGREYRIPLSALVDMAHGDIVRLGWLPAGSALVRGPEISDDGRDLVMGFLCPSDRPVSTTITLRNGEGEEIRLESREATGA